jgi:hypothetical protein
MHSREWVEQKIEIEDTVTHIYTHRKAKVKVIYKPKIPRAELLQRDLWKVIHEYVDAELKYQSFAEATDWCEVSNATVLKEIKKIHEVKKRLQNCIDDILVEVPEDVTVLDALIDHKIRVLDRLHRDRGGYAHLPKKFVRRLLLNMVKTVRSAG